MESAKSKPLSSLIFIPLLSLIFIRPFFSGLAYPTLEIYYESIVIFLAILTFIAEVKYRFRIFPETFDNFPVLLLLLAYSISTIYSINLQNSVRETMKFISFFAIFFMVSQTGESQKKTLIKTIVLAAVIISVYSIYQYFWGFQHTIDYLKNTNSDFLLTSSYGRDILLAKRAIGTFPSPNILGSYLIICFFLSLSLVQGLALDKHCPRLSLGHIGLALITTALLLTKSMGAWLSLFGALIILFIISYNSLKNKKTVLIASVAFIALSLAFILATRWERLMNLDNPQNSITQRLNYWRTAITMIKDHPFLGVGPGNFQEVFLKYKVGLSTDTRYAHNIFLHTWAETGILGLMALMYLITNFIIKAKSKSRFIFLAGLVFLFHNLIDNTYFIPEAGFLWWVLAGWLIISRGHELHHKNKA